jgi:hypothetical protein
MPNEMEELTRIAGGSGRKPCQAELVDAIIEHCGGDPRAALVAMLEINSALMMELQALTGMRAHEPVACH